MSTFLKRRIVSRETLGEKLKKVREGRNFSLRDIERVIGIRAYYLEDLETGNYLNLPGEIYVRNFLKAYIDFLGLDKEEVLEQYAEERKSLDYDLMTKYVAGSHDLFGNKVKPKGLIIKSSLRDINLFRLFKWGAVILSVLLVLVYLGLEIKKFITPPALTIFTPTDNLVTKEISVKITGQTTPGSLVMVNDQEIFCDTSGRFEEMISLKLGFNEIKILAKKKPGREAVIYRKVMVETEP